MTKYTKKVTPKGDGRKTYARTNRTSSNHTAKCGAKRKILKDRIRALYERVTELERLTDALIMDHNNPRVTNPVGSAPGALGESSPLSAPLAMEATRFSPDLIGGTSPPVRNELLPSGGGEEPPIDPPREMLKRQAPTSSSSNQEAS